MQLPQSEAPYMKMACEYLHTIRHMIPVQKAVLYGPYAQGDQTPNSDVFLAVFSDAFRTMPPIQSIALLLNESPRYTKKYLIDMHPMPYTYERYKNPDPFVQNIIETGIEVPLDD